MIDKLRHDAEGMARSRNIEVVERTASRLPADIADNISRQPSKLDLAVFLLILRSFYQFADEQEWFRWTNLVCKFLTNEFQAMLIEQEWTLKEVRDYKVWLSEDIGDILFLRHHGILDAGQCREVFRQCWNGLDVLSVLQKSEVLNRVEGNILAQVVAKHLAANPKVVMDYKKGRKQSINSLIGPILREIKADASEIRKLLAQQVEQ